MKISNYTIVNEQERICFMILVLAFVGGVHLSGKKRGIFPGAFSAVKFFDETPGTSPGRWRKDTRNFFFFLGGGKFFWFTREVGKWKVGRWDELIVQTKLLMAQKSGEKTTWDVYNLVNNGRN